MKSRHYWPNGPTSFSPGQRPGSEAQRAGSEAHRAGTETPPRRWPNGPTSLSPGHRPGWMTPIDRRPVGPRFVLAWSGVQTYRAPLARRNLFGATDPGRCPGLRNDAPLARRHFLWPNGPTSLSPGQRPGWMTPIDRRPVGTRYGIAWFDVPPYRAPLARANPTGANPGRCPGLRNDAPLARTES